MRDSVVLVSVGKLRCNGTSALALGECARQELLPDDRYVVFSPDLASQIHYIGDLFLGSNSPKLGHGLSSGHRWSSALAGEKRGDEPGGGWNESLDVIP